MQKAWDYIHIKPSKDSGKRTKCLVVSDLHLGASYSDAYEAESLLREKLNDPELKHCILLGDIYEGVNLPDKKKAGAFERAAKQHISHLREMIKDHPNVQFHMVLGNHERIPEYDYAFDALAKELGPERLTITRHFLKMGDGLFLHGDQAMNPRKYVLPDVLEDHYEQDDPRYRSSYEEIERPGWWQAVHDFGNVHAPWPAGRIFHRPEQCAKRIFSWAHAYDERNPVEKTGKPPVLEDIKHIFMGHTHDPFTGKKMTDSKTGTSYRFYNTGASIYRAGPYGRINRHCFNALEVYLNMGNKIDEVVSVKWPQHHWVDPNSQEANQHVSSLMAREAKSAGITR